MVGHLQSLNCTSYTEIFEYFAAEDRVLLELYAQSKASRPSLTRLKQLTLQFALDPRQNVTVPKHRLMICRHVEGYEVGILPPAYACLPPLSGIGFIVRDHFARRMFDIVLGKRFDYRAMMQLIETFLGYVPKQNGAEVLSAPFTPATAVQVDRGDSCVIVLGKRYVLDSQLVEFMHALLELPGEWVSSAKLEANPLFAGVRIDRLIRKLPVVVFELIERCRGKGYRLSCERLKQLCQKSSIAM